MPGRLFSIALFAALLSPALLLAAIPTVHPLPEFPLKTGDRICWHGSSSTMIGVWPRTVEFLFRTRHPELKLEFVHKGVGGGNFTLALKKLDGTLDDAKPTVMFFNFGGNDAIKGAAGIPAFKAVMKQVLEKTRAFPALPILLTPQPGDERMALGRNDYLGLYTQAMQEFARAEGYALIDTYHPLEELQFFTQNDIPNYTINKDRIHLTDSAYVAWGFMVYEGLRTPAAESSATLNAEGKVTAEKRCKISNIHAHDGHLAFDREDEILPLLPPALIPVTKWTEPTSHLLSPDSPVREYAYAHGSELPPRKHSPLEKHSLYLLKVEGLTGTYTLTVDGKPLGEASAEQLAAGVNLNSLLLDSTHEAPWAKLALELWNGKNLNKIGKTKFRFDLKRKK